jgi:hypothetical protein
LAATNRAPAFLGNPFTAPAANAGQPYSASLAAHASDPNGDAITFGKVGGPPWLSLANNGNLSGTPLSPDAGTNVFTVRVTDSGGLSSTGTMNVVVLPAPPLVTTAALQAADLLLNWTGGIAPFQVQFAPNLPGTNWQNLGGPTNARSLLVTPTNGAAFYRVYGR